ncbi:hypothetical protein DFA_00954 [Cavenderia fasciculata]|uniref:Uncharacterized protein n=1 Tax=Cavenderia fasciculata TaxID=261658 RepID=F4PUR0_CACFS|nr:uncharacterized protein DFA_00954 [Cavenderia fasciculata]EGG21079.1 hypothetical protein DFA_00954 [Cavenderia fasciculata]|eukprot:XP_004358929.1 hypothetical protein DFA_00954 [Cavenderia fasciculata]
MGFENNGRGNRKGGLTGGGSPTGTPPTSNPTGRGNFFDPSTGGSSTGGPFQA